jgi:ATP-dependent Zn protease
MEGGGRRYSEETAHDIDEAVKQRLDTAFEQAKRILQGRRAELDRFARRLLEEETLDEDELAPLRRASGSVGAQTADTAADTATEGAAARPKSPVEPAPVG